MTFTDADRAKAVATRMENKRLREAGQLPPIVRKTRKQRTNGESHAEHVSEVRREAVLSRWESVKEEQEKWLKPFTEQPIDVAMRYLEDLRIIIERGGKIMNARINENSKIQCSGPHCGKDLTGLRPNGFPKWIAKKDFKDKNFPDIFHSLYFCSELCNQEWVRAQMGAGGTDGK